MHTHETDRIVATSEQLAIFAGELAVAVAKAKPSFAHMQRVLGSKVATRKAVIAVLRALEIGDATDPRLAHSQALWAKLGIPIDCCLDELTMPDIPEGWTGVAIIPTLSNEALFGFCEKHFLSWKYYDDLDSVTSEQSRPKRAYVLGHHGGVEPDVAHRNKSYDQCTKEGLIFLTLKERLCIELLHFAATGEPLDKVGITITSSLASDGGAFDAFWGLGDRKFLVGGYHPRDASATYGPRQAVFA
jgi:hypothetical protein